MGGLYISPLRSLQYFTSAYPIFFFSPLNSIVAVSRQGRLRFIAPLPFFATQACPHVREQTYPFADKRACCVANRWKTQQMGGANPDGKSNRS